MAKISAEFDTVTKELIVKMDGKDMADVAGVHFYNDKDMYSDGEDHCSCSLTTRTNNTDEGYASYTNIIAKNTPAAQQAIHAGIAKAFAGSTDFIETPGKSLLQDEISTLLNRRKRRYA